MDAVERQTIEIIMIKSSSDQTTITVSCGQIVLEPIDVRIRDTAEDVFIILEPSSSATITLWSDSHALIGVMHRNIHCILHENAVLTMYYNDFWPKDSNVVAETDVKIEQKSSSMLYYKHSMRGGAQIKQRFSLMASGMGAQATIRGNYEINSAGSANITTLQYHNAAYTVSNLLFKTIVRDAGIFTHHGTIVITKEGKQTESAQHTHTLLLSDAARATSVPNIEVSTHEVQCGHGSAIGRLDEEQLWYLQARGLSRINAEQVLIDGFLGEHNNEK